MTTKRFLASAGAYALACAMLIALGGEGRDVANAAGAAQNTGQPAARGGGGGQRGGGGDTMDPGTLISGAWGAAPLPVDSRGWGWMTQGYVGPTNKRPFWNRAKEMLFSGKQVTSYTISNFDPTF